MQQAVNSHLIAVSKKIDILFVLVNKKLDEGGKNLVCQGENFQPKIVVQYLITKHLKVIINLINLKVEDLFVQVVSVKKLVV